MNSSNIDNHTTPPRRRSIQHGDDAAFHHKQQPPQHDSISIFGRSSSQRQPRLKVSLILMPLGISIIAFSAVTLFLNIRAHDEPLRNTVNTHYQLRNFDRPHKKGDRLDKAANAALLGSRQQSSSSTKVKGKKGGDNDDADGNKANAMKLVLDELHLDMENRYNDMKAQMNQLHLEMQTKLKGEQSGLREQVAQKDRIIDALIPLLEAASKNKNESKSGNDDTSEGQVQVVSGGLPEVEVTPDLPEAEVTPDLPDVEVTPGRPEAEVTPDSSSNNIASSGANNDLKLLQELTTGKTKKRGDGSTSTNCPSPLQLFENRIVDNPPSSSNSNTTRIPKIIHLSERSRCLNRDMYDALEKWKENFPSYSIFFHDDEAVDRLLLSEEGVYSDWRKDFPDLVEILPCVSQGAMKIDIWRVLVLYKFGGLYFDADIVPDKLTEDTINPDSSWFSLTDAWARPSQWLFATSAGHVSCKNTLQIIAKRVLDQRDIQDIALVHTTGPQALYSGWKDAIVNGTEPHSTTNIEGKTHRFTDGSWGQKIEEMMGPGSSWISSSYWDEMVPFEKDLCVSRKTRTQKHFGRVHWTTAKGTGRTGLPRRLSCRKHLESLHLDQQKKEHPDEDISAKVDTIATKGNGALLTTNIDDLILKNSNNATMCAQLAKEDEEKKEKLRSSSSYCGSCKYLHKVTCDARIEYLISKHQLSVEDAFQDVLDKGGDKCKQSK